MFNFIKKLFCKKKKVVVDCFMIDFGYPVPDVGYIPKQYNRDKKGRFAKKGVKNGKSKC